jgi:hypothetical protein
MSFKSVEASSGDHCPTTLRKSWKIISSNACASRMVAATNETIDCLTTLRIEWETMSTTAVEVHED